MRGVWANRARSVSTATAFEALVASGSYYMADLVLILLRFGAAFGFTPIAYTSASVNITWDGTTYSALGSKMLRGPVRTSLGTDVDTLDLTLHPYVTTPNPKAADASDTTVDVIPGTTVSLPHAARAGLFDQAHVELWRLFLPGPPQWHQTLDVSAGAVQLFLGDVGEIETRRSVMQLTVRSRLDQLNVQLPRNQYQPGCLNGLYDTVCNLSRTGSANGRNFQASATINGSLSTTMELVLNATPSQPAGFFDLGYVEIASGPFVFLRRGIKWHVGNRIALIEPFLPEAIPNGQSVTLQAGCDKQLATCRDKYANLARFRGMPFIPSPDSAY